MKVTGTFEVTMSAEPPYDVVDEVTLGRVSFDKQFSGPLEATATVQMIGVRTPVDGSAGYVAVERVSGTLDGKHGTFVLQHTGTMNKGTNSLAVTVVPDSGTGDLKGLAGRMEIQIVGGKHFYEFEFEFDPRR
jgi:hypothetical protein